MSSVRCRTRAPLQLTVRRALELVTDGAVGDLISFNATNITLSPVWAFPWQGDPEKSYGSRVPLKPGDARFRGGPADSPRRSRALDHADPV